MLELPESTTIAKQLSDTIKGKIITYAKANHSPHSFAWYFNHPEGYGELLEGKQIGEAYARSGMIEIEAEDCRIVFADGANPRYYDNLKDVPQKHQLYLEFDDQTALVCTIQMYGGLWAYHEGENTNSYYLGAKTKPSPLTEQFDYSYFCSLRDDKTPKLSVKAFLATEQRIPGLGNGTLQDILFVAGIHPKRKMAQLTEAEFGKLFDTVKDVLLRMTQKGGRDTEKDLYGNNGGYQTLLSKKTLWAPCTVCGYELHKENYMGGTIYFCEHCQK